MNHRGTEGAEDEKRDQGSEQDPLTQAVIGAAIEVHRYLGPGLLEAVYEDALAVELGLRDLPFRRQVPVVVSYKGQSVGQGRVDLLVAERLVVELKAVEHLGPLHMAQVLSYLKAANLPLGLLITFNVPVLRLGIRRIIRTP